MKHHCELRHQSWKWMAFLNTLLITDAKILPEIIRSCLKSSFHHITHMFKDLEGEIDQIWTLKQFAILWGSDFKIISGNPFLDLGASNWVCLLCDNSSTWRFNILYSLIHMSYFYITLQKKKTCGIQLNWGSEGNSQP